MNRDRLKFGAALARFALAAYAFLFLPVIYPPTRPCRWVWVAYFFSSAIAQQMIRRRAGGRARTILFGVVDAAVLTFTVHLLGSVSSPLVSLYFFACVANAIVGDLGITLVLAAVNALLYDGVVWA